MKFGTLILFVKTRKEKLNMKNAQLRETQSETQSSNKKFIFTNEIAEATNAL